MPIISDNKCGHGKPLRYFQVPEMVARDWKNDFFQNLPNKINKQRIIYLFTILPKYYPANFLVCWYTFLCI